ncbi:hypothetical protein GOBAR_AA01524 [Gossypium barbadense]|uniref:Uncharacterized protein n=1 Tax=Gossypium barbadense TaxID=3634 RepID=A0A2P5YTW3_GOSBA|nr:hypothetical protein GOBAR_AA01524 [Gossypium barbadense]
MKGASSSSGPTAKIRHPFVQFPKGPQEELFQILRAEPLATARCIDWAAVEQVKLADGIRALLTTDPWEQFFEIIEQTYLELIMELLVRQLSVPEFGAALGLYTEEFREQNDLDTLNRHIRYSPSKCWIALVPRSAIYDPSRTKASSLPPSLRGRAPASSLPTTSITCGVCPTAMSSTSPTSSPLPYATKRSDTGGGHLYWPLRDSTGVTLQTPQHRGPGIIPHPHRPDVSTRHLEHA